jgi:hypothetical protein
MAERGLGVVEPAQADQRVCLQTSPVEDARTAPGTEEPGGAHRFCREKYPGQVTARESERGVSHRGGGHRQDDRKPLGRAPGRADVRLRGRPLAAESQHLGDAGVRPREVERTVGVLGQWDRQLSVRDDRRRRRAQPVPAGR